MDRFPMERWLEEHNGTATWDLSRSGYYPWTLRELLDPAALDGVLDERQRYTDNQGGARIRSLVADTYPGRSAENVVITSGTTESNWLAVQELIAPGDEVIVLEPTYQQVPLAARHAGAAIRPILARPELGWHYDLDEIEAAVTDRTAMIYVCQPANPTGMVLDAAEIDRILQVAQRHGTWVVSDEIYRGTEHGTGQWSPSFDRGYGRVVITGSLSKTYGLPGLRTGWIIGGDEFIGSVAARREYISAWVTRPSEAVAAAALEPATRDALVDKCRRRLRANLPILLDWVARHADVVRLVTPTATPMAYLELSAGAQHALGSVDIADTLRKQASVLVLPAALFQTVDAPRVRVTYGVTPDHLRGALGAFETALEGRAFAGADA